MRLKGSSNTSTEPSGWESRAIFIFGIVFLSTILTLATAFPDPTPFQYTTFRIVLALSVAGIAAFVPGFLHLKIGNIIKAGGALSVFCVVYFFSPAGLVASPEPPPPPPKENAKLAISSWLDKIDNGDYADAWGEISSEGKKRFYKNLFIETFENQRTPLGIAVERDIYGLSQINQLPDGTIGNFAIYTYRTLFKNVENHLLEQVTVVVEENEWRVLFHMFYPDPTTNSFGQIEAMKEVLESHESNH
ncbi:DUF4019 domain-containing protein [Pelagicoccus mobilis]|uniref:DUF4019 domain-containing protein n=1 Tax=Pelagicoccus mobilis TaxID=415221 RepID=A0A934VQ55_9BACT|nr:DUF4019 domain-containing protein [Pelagicoccus mobilis]MBK1877987.1 DUF4019 domain-containing protein [Pelagicoccus mobilis]